MGQATLTSKGQVTIPKAIREQMDLRTGDRLDFIVAATGEMLVRRVSWSADQVQGMLSHRARAPVSVDQMDSALALRFSRQRP